MIFILTESIMNGTVTMYNKVTGIEAKDWEEAIKKLRSLPNISKFDIQEEETIVYLYLKKEFIESFPCNGIMLREPLKIL